MSYLQLHSNMVVLLSLVRIIHDGIQNGIHDMVKCRQWGFLQARLHDLCQFLTLSCILLGDPFWHVLACSWCFLHVEIIVVFTASSSGSWRRTNVKKRTSNRAIKTQHLLSHVCPLQNFQDLPFGVFWSCRSIWGLRSDIVCHSWPSRIFPVYAWHCRSWTISSRSSWPSIA